MQIVVLGAGTVGSSIADILCQHGHRVTVVDNDPAHTRRLDEELDVGAITGSASESSVMFQAGIMGCDLCLAVTGDDEVNLVAASMAKAMGAHRSIARVYAPIFRDMSTFDYQGHFRIDRLVSLEHLAALELARGIRNPGSLAVENFVRGQLEVLEWEVHKATKVVGVPLKQLKLPQGVRVGCIIRNGQTWIAGADDCLEPLDRVTVIGHGEAVEGVRGSFQKRKIKKKFIVIAGGGETGFHLARTLEGERFSVVLMDVDPDRNDFLSKNLKHATVVSGDATRKQVLEEERVQNADVFVACFGDDEDNIMACVEAREIGAASVMAIVGRPDYANVVGKLGIDLAVSPRNVMAKQVLSFLQSGPVVSRTPLSAGDIDVVEIEVRPGAVVANDVLANLRLPPKCLIAAAAREDYVHVPGAKDRLKPGDTVVALVGKQHVDQLVPLFTGEG